MARSSTTGGRATRSATTSPTDGSLSPQYVIERLGAIAGPDAIYAAGVGPAPDVGRAVHEVREAGHLAQLRRRSARWATPSRRRWAPSSAGPDTTVWAIDGDGCFQMTNQELATCAIEGIPIKVAVINNGNLGMVRQWQTLFYEDRYSNTDLQHATQPSIPDFVKLAEALGCVGLRCETNDDVDATIEKAMEINDRPVVIDFVVAQDAMVWPMVAAGTSNDDIQAARDIAPEFGTARRIVADEPATRCPCWSRTSPVSWPGSRRCSAAAVQHRVARRRADRAPRPVPDDDRRRRVEAAPLEQVTKQLNKLVNVLKIVELDAEPPVQRELLLVKVKARPRGRRRTSCETVELFRAKVVDVAPDAVTIEATGTPDKLEALLRVLEPFGSVTPFLSRQVVRSSIVIRRDWI